MRCPSAHVCTERIDDADIELRSGIFPKRIRAVHGDPLRRLRELWLRSTLTVPMVSMEQLRGGGCGVVALTVTDPGKHTIN